MASTKGANKMNSENIIEIAGIGIFATWMIALCVIAFWMTEKDERKNRKNRKHAMEIHHNELRGQGRLLLASNSVTRGE